MTLDECYQEQKQKIDALDARVLICHVLNISPEEFILHKKRILTDAQGAAIDTLVAQRQTHMPVAKITGRKYFYDLEFKTTTDTLDPRPDSETLIDVVLKRKTKAARILDLGTGTGCLGLTLLHHIAHAHAVLVDVSRAALDVARHNAETLNLVHRVACVHGHWFDGVSGMFDVIVSNPPYIPTADMAGLAPDVRHFDPRLALDGGADGLDPYRMILGAAGRFAAPNALIALEVGAGQATDVAAMAAHAGFQNIEIHNDLSGIGRVVSGFWL